MPQTLTAYLKDLNVAINFVAGTKIEEDKPLAEYMQSFARDLSYLPDTIKLRHIRDVWLLIKYELADLLMREHQVWYFYSQVQYMVSFVLIYHTSWGHCNVAITIEWIQILTYCICVSITTVLV